MASTSRVIVFVVAAPSGLCPPGTWITSAAPDPALPSLFVGRRQVVKSRLVQELCDRSGLPYVYFTAVKGASMAESTVQFLRALAESDLPSDRALLPEQPPGGGSGDMFRLLAGVLPEGPSIVVIDELPWLAEQDDTFDGHLQAAWDRLLSRRPVLLLLLGSDLHMMQQLTAYDRPFFGRADNLVLGPFNLAETADATNLSGSDAIDAHLITGGLPGIALRWRAGTPAEAYLEDQCADPASPLFVVPEQSLASQFPAPDTARRVLEAVGGDTRAFTTIASAAWGRGGWLGTAFDGHDLRQLQEGARMVPGFDPARTGLAVVSRSGADLPDGSSDVIWGPEEVVAAWRA